MKKTEESQIMLTPNGQICAISNCRGGYSHYSNAMTASSKNGSAIAHNPTKTELQTMRAKNKPKLHFFKEGRGGVSGLRIRIRGILIFSQDPDPYQK